MRFSANTSVILDTLRIANFAVPGKTTIQVLQNFLLRLEGNWLEVFATDFDLGIRIKAEVQGERDGEIVVNAHRLLDIIKAQPAPDIGITIDVNDYLVKIQTQDGFEAELTGFDAAEFPDFPEIGDKGDSATVSRSELAFLAEKTMFAVSTDSARLSLNGVFCHHQDGKMLFVATDGHRLGLAHLEHEGQDWSAGVILPTKVLNSLMKVAEDDTPMEMRTSENYILFSSENLQVASKLIDGPYPKYENVVPSSFERTAVMQRDKFINELVRVSSIANARTRQIRLRLDGDTLTVSTRNADIGGNTRGVLPVEYSSEDVLELGFNANYLLEILRKCPCDEIMLKMNGALGACIIEPQGEGMDFFFLLMPLRLPD
jgi:DNA polymerase III subunit beta